MTGAGSSLLRLGDGPIVSPASCDSIGYNIQGPSLIEVPAWLPNALGRYYLYFADHKGRHIRVAFADDLSGPWSVYAPGSLQLGESHFPAEDLPLSDERLAQITERVRSQLGDASPADIRTDLTAAHIASPDVHCDDEGRRLIMYFHGLESVGTQVSRVAVSTDGLAWTVQPEVLIDRTYLRVFTVGDGYVYGLAMPGTLYRATDWLGPFEEGPTLFEPNFRHCAVDVHRDDARIDVYWTRVGDRPERILCSMIDTSSGWTTWTESEAVEVLRPEQPWEGADLPEAPSIRGAVNERVNQLRDPAILRTSDDQAYLAYAVAGESGIAIAAMG